MLFITEEVLRKCPLCYEIKALSMFLCHCLILAKIARFDYHLANDLFELNEPLS